MQPQRRLRIWMLAALIALTLMMPRRGRSFATINVPGGSASAAIQALINGSLPGDTIVFQSGTDNISTPVLFYSNRTYQCSGATLHGGGTSELVDLQDPVSNITISGGCIFDGGGIFSPGSTAAANNITITGNTFQNIGANNSLLAGQSGILFGGLGVSHSLVNLNTFSNIFSQNIVTATDQGANGIRIYNADNTSIVDNTFTSVNQGISIQFNNAGPYPGMVVSRNIMTRVHRMGIEMQNQNTQGMIVDSNQVSNFYNPFYNSFGLSIVVDGGSDTVVSNNILDGSVGSGYGYGLEAGGIRTQVRNNTVKGNFISGIELGGVVNGTITANLLCGSAGVQQILWEGTPDSGTSISGNTLQSVCPAAGGTPDMTLTKTHSGIFTQGGTAIYTLTAHNLGSGATLGSVTVSDPLPTGLTATAMSGAGWVCTLGTVSCTNAAALPAGASYPAITLTTHVAANAPPIVQNTATVSGGGETNSSNDTSSDQAGVGSAVAPASDEFNTGGLNTAMWTPYTPAGGTVSVVTTAGVGELTLAVPIGVHDPIAGGNNSVRVLQSIANGDFDVAAKFDSTPSAATQGQGILVEQDLTNYMRFETYFAAGSTVVYASSIAGGVEQGQIGVILPAPITPLWLQVRRVANAWTLSYSPDGVTYTTAGTFTYSLSVTAVGPYAWNGGTGPAFTSTVDYFRTLTPDLTVNKTHSGNFTQGGTGTYTITANNAGGAPTVGGVTMTDTLPAGLTPVSLAGAGWTCTLSPLVCSRGDPLAAGTSYPAMTLVVNVSGTAPSLVTNTAAIAGGGEINTANDQALDLTVVSASAATTITNVSVIATPTQAAISFNVTDPTLCTLQVSTDPLFVGSVNDTNTLLFPGSQNCNRASSSVSGTRVVFVAGARTSRAGSDGAFYSLALEANRVHYYRITANTAGTAPVVFTCTAAVNCIQTVNPPFGNTYPEPPPFDIAAPYHYAWPTIRPGLDRNKFINDPMTGFAMMPITGPSQSINGLGSSVHANWNGAVAFDSTATWTGLANGAVIDAAVATNAAASLQPLFVRDNRWCLGGATVQPQGSTRACVDGSWGWNGGDQTNFYSIDDYQVRIAASGSGATAGMQFALTYDGVNPFTDWQSASVGSVIATTVLPAAFPSTLNGGTAFGAWYASRLGKIPMPCLTPHTGTATVAGSVVTWASGEHFLVDCIAAGSYLTLGATDYFVSAVSSPNSLTITSPPSAGTYNFWQFNLGALVRKATATTGNLNIDGIQFSSYESRNFTSPNSGVVRFVSTSVLADSTGVAGRLMILFDGFDRWLYFLEEVSGKSRYLGGALIASCNTNTCAAGVTNAANQYRGAQPATWYTFRPADSRHFYGFDTDYNNKTVVIDQFYDNTRATSSDCPGNYQEITPANCSTYPVNQAISQVNATPAVDSTGADRTLISQMTAYNTAQRIVHPEIPVFEAAKFSGVQPNINDYGNGWMSVTTYAGQDTFGWTAWFDPASTPPFNLVAMTNSYANSVRFASIHGTGSLMGYEGLSSNILADGQSGVGRGRWILKTTTSTDNTTQNACPGGLTGIYSSYSGTNRCFTLTLAGTDPCHDTPNLSTETAPTYGACGWNGAYTHLAGVVAAVGDLLDDTSDSGEMFAVVAVSGSTITVIRAYGTPATVTGTNARQSALAAHTQPWLLRELSTPTSGNNGGAAYCNLNTDPNGLACLTDYPMDITGHLDTAEAGIMAEPPRYRIGSSLGAMFGTPFTFTATETGPFGSYSSGAGNFLQAHPGLSREAAHPYYTIDKNPYSANGGNNNQLWNQTADLVTGSLWHIAGANVQKDSATPWPGGIKTVPYVMWSGGYLLQDVSGPACAIGGTSSDNWKFGVVFHAGECVAGSVVGDVYANIPQSAHDGKCGPWDYTRNICGSTLDNTAGGLNQYQLAGITPGTTINDGRTYRRLGSLFNRLNFESIYSSAAGHPGGQWAFGHSDFYSGLRSDLFIVKMPPPPPLDGIVRNDFGNVPIVVPSAASPNARIRFGYAENGAPASYYCAYNRKEACYTSPVRTTTAPYFFAGDTGQAYQPCSTGCTINIPAIPGRLAYYAVDRLDAFGAVVSTGPMQVASFQAAGGGVGTFGACDLNQDGVVNALDVQLVVNMNLGVLPCGANINGTNVCTATTIARVVTAAVGGACVLGP